MQVIKKSKLFVARAHSLLTLQHKLTNQLELVRTTNLLCVLLWQTWMSAVKRDYDSDDETLADVMARVTVSKKHKSDHLAYGSRNNPIVIPEDPVELLAKVTQEREDMQARLRTADAHITQLRNYFHERNCRIARHEAKQFARELVEASTAQEKYIDIIHKLYDEEGRLENLCAMRA